MPLLMQRLTESNSQLCFLIDFVTLSPLDMKLNRETMEWPKRMPSVFKQHRQIVAEKTRQYQSGLKVCVCRSVSQQGKKAPPLNSVLCLSLQLCCERFLEELESYSSQVKEFVTFEELDDLSKYLKKAKKLNTKLELAMEKVRTEHNYKVKNMITAK